MDNIKIEHCSNIKVTKKKDNHKYLCLLFSSPPLNLSFAVRLPSHIQHMSKMRITPSLSILLICLLFLCLDIPPSSSLLPPPPFLCLSVVWNTERESSLSRSFCLACSNSNSKALLARETCCCAWTALLEVLYAYTNRASFPKTFCLVSVPGHV